MMVPKRMLRIKRLTQVLVPLPRSVEDLAEADP
jgi:hypothetical protein